MVKNAVVTGASSGVGRATAIALAKEGYNVIGIARDRIGLDETAQAVQKAGGRFRGTVCDVSSKQTARRACRTIRKRYGRVDVLVNNAGVLFIDTFARMSLEKMETMMNTNYWGTVYFTKELLSVIPKGGTVVNVSSIVGRIGIPYWAVYCASKFAVVGLSEALYYELRERGIHVALICPAGVRTNLYEKSGLSKTTVQLSSSAMMSPGKVADAIICSIRNRDFESEVTLRVTIFVYAKNLLPSIARLLILRRYRR